MNSAGTPSRGEVWLAVLDPIEGHEQGGTRPCVILSDDIFNRGPADLVVVLPITSIDRRQALHIEVNVPEGGLQRRSFVMCDQIRTIAKGRLVQRWGTLSAGTLGIVGHRVRALLAL